MRRSWTRDSDGNKIVYAERGASMLLDELSIYERSLSSSEVRSLAKNYRLFDSGR